MRVKLPEHGLGLPEFVLQLPHELPPDQEIEQEDVEDVHNEDGPVLNILSVKARDINEGLILTRN
jgi:hypothetical protein